LCKMKVILLDDIILIDKVYKLAGALSLNSL
jgi:hypothetical protein